MAMVDQFLMMVHFVAYVKMFDVTHIIDLYFKEIIQLYGVPKTVTSGREIKFLRHFWQTLWGKLGTKV